MKRKVISLAVASVLLVSCQKENSILQTHPYNERSSGDLALDPVNVIVIENLLGPVIIQGNSDISRVGWFLDKWVNAESPSSADPVFSQILVNLESRNDTAFVAVRVPPGTFSSSSLLSLSLPANIPCILRNIRGSSSVSYMKSNLVGENVATTTIVGQEGNCIVAGSSGNASLEISLPDSGLCSVTLVSGDIALKIPTATSAMLFAQTGDGTIFHSTLVIADSVRTEASITGKLGGGRGSIHLSTGKGNITITGIQ